MLEAEFAPPFTLLDQDAKEVSLGDYAESGFCSVVPQSSDSC